MEIPKTNKTLEERGITEGSFFRVLFQDGTECDEHSVNWSEMSEPEEVGYFGSKKVVYLSKFPVKRLGIFHEDINEIIDIPEGGRAYQGIRSETFIIGDAKRTRNIGRFFGVVIEGEVSEEYFLDFSQNKVVGLKV